MAVTTTLSNHYKYMLKTGEIDESSDTLKIILMNTTFTFDEDAHATLANVTADQLSTGNGYTQNDKTLANVSVQELDASDKASTTCDDVSWTASGGSIGPFGALIIYDDSTSDDTVIGCIDLGTDYTITDGSSYLQKDITIDLT